MGFLDALGDALRDNSGGMASALAGGMSQDVYNNQWKAADMAAEQASILKREDLTRQAAAKEAHINKIISEVANGTIKDIDKANAVLQQLGYSGPPVGLSKETEVEQQGLLDKQKAAEQAAKLRQGLATAGNNVDVPPPNQPAPTVDPATGALSVTSTAPLTGNTIAPPDDLVKQKQESAALQYGNDALVDKIAESKLAPKQETKSEYEKILIARYGSLSDPRAQKAMDAWIARKDAPTSTMIKVQGVGGANSLTGNALDDAAQQYRTTGIMPSLGMGGVAEKVKIMNRASELSRAAGDDAQAAAIQKQVGKASVGALTQLTRQETMVGAFEKNAVKNADLALSMSDKVDRAGSPVLDKWIQAGRKNVTGSPEVAAFNAANQSFVNEYAKVISGSMGNTAVSDSARQHAMDMLSTAMTKDQYKAVISTLKQEMNNRMAGFSEQKKSLITGISGTVPDDTSTAKPSDNKPDPLGIR